MATTLSRIVARLADVYGPVPAPFPVDPFELVIWESIAYLADDDRRAEALNQLRETVGTRPDQLLEADGDELIAVAAHGIMAKHSASKLRAAAEIAIGEFDGDLDEVLQRSAPQAKKALRRFPGIGEPGAEKILLYRRKHPSLAPESNALRVLVRLGCIASGKSYSATYAAARAAGREEWGDDFDGLLAARHYLRLHGKELCRRTTPRCETCVLRKDCAFGRAASGAD